MDPATILILIGAYYAVTRGFKLTRAVSHAASAAAVPKSSGKGSTPGGGMPAWLNRQRHTGTGWWAGEIRHGFPVFRAGVREGWAHHQTAMAQRQAEAAGTVADGHERWLTYRAEREAHRQRIEAARQEAERQKQAAEAARTPATPRPPATPVMAPPPADGSTPDAGRGGQQPARPGQHGNLDGNGQYINDPASWRDDPAATCSDPECEYCGGAGGGSGGSGKQPAGSKPAGTTTGGTMSDTTYEGTEATLEDIRGRLDYATNDEVITTAENLADSLPASLPDDAETVGHIAEVAAALREVQEAQQRAIDACEAAKSSHEKNNRASKEAADAQGGAPEREYVVNG